MKKIVFAILLFMVSLTVTYANEIDSIDMEIYIDEFGNASITEIWAVEGNNGTEWYKVYNNLGDSKLTDFKVYMDNKLLEYKEWDIDESLTDKKGYYGINYTVDGLELCFGKYDYDYHVFKLEYKLSNFVFNTSDSQVLYWKLIDKLSNVDFDNFSVEISSYYSFPDTLDVWGYGYKGYAYVEDGKIKMSNENSMNNKYVVLLAKFPLNTFNNDTTYSQFSDFDAVYKMAKKGSYSYEFIQTISVIINILIFYLIIYFLANKLNYGYINNKKIDKKNTPMFRDIPCNKDIYYANALISLNKFTNSKANILGAILLKWIKLGKVEIINNGKSNSLLLKKDVILESKDEQELFDMMYVASMDGNLEKNELERWARKNYDKYLNLFDKIKNNKIFELEKQGHIYKRKNRKECKYGKVMDDTLYEDSKKLYGLKLFLEEFSNIKDKEAIEVHLWDQYLMFAFLFGMADKVAKQFRNLYPEVFETEEFTNQYGSFETIYYLNRISYSSVNAASSARSAAESYSSGGGGFSRGGGGFGSFGGGGGGSR